jgi:outer membrane protein
MKFKKYILIILTNIIFQNANAQNLDSLTLPQLTQFTKNQQIAKERAALNANLAQLNFAIYKASLKPQIDLNARIPNYSKSFREVVQPNGSILFQSVTNNNSSLGLSMSQVIPKTGGTVFLQTNLQRFDDFENDFKNYNGLPIQLTLFQPLFGFNPMKWDKEIEPLKLREAEKQEKVDLAMLDLQAVTLFFNLSIAYQDFEIAKANEKSNQQLLTIAEERFALGKISKSDLMQLQLSLVSAEKDKRRALQAVKTASADIYSFLGLAIDNQVIKPIETVVFETKNLDTETILAKAKKNRPEIEAFYRMKLEAERAVEKAKKESGLQANLTASFGLARSSENLQPIYTNPQQVQYLQLQLSMPILDWGQRAAQRQISIENQQFTTKFITQQETEFKNNILQTIARFENAQQELILVEKIKKLAEERFKITQESYVLGAISITDLTLAQREKDLAQRDYISTLSLYWQAVYELEVWTLE